MRRCLFDAVDAQRCALDVPRLMTRFSSFIVAIYQPPCRLARRYYFYAAAYSPPLSLRRFDFSAIFFHATPL